VVNLPGEYAYTAFEEYRKGKPKDEDLDEVLAIFEAYE